VGVGIPMGIPMGMGIGDRNSVTTAALGSGVQPRCFIVKLKIITKLKIS